MKYVNASQVAEDGASASMEKLTDSLGDVETHRELLERGVNSDFRGNFFESQCRYLEQQLTESSILIKELVANHAASDPSFVSQPVLDELRRLIEAGRTLIKNCEDETCQKAYLRMGERTEAFAETLKEMLWCSSLMLYYKRKKLGHGSSALTMNDFPQPRLGEKELCTLAEAAIDDQNKLYTTLESWQMEHSCSAVECGVHGNASCLAAQIKVRGKQVYSLGDPTSLFTVAHRDVVQKMGQIGRGGYGTVYEVKWLGDDYAMKEFLGKPDPGDKNEVRAMADLSHPHIVKPFACSRPDSQSFFFLMELMPSDLKKFLEDAQRPNFSLSAGIDLMLQISEAMRFIHDKGVVHRNLKPANILLRPSDDPKCPGGGPVLAKVADFGLARVKEEVISNAQLTRGLSSGALDWKAPELLPENKSDPKRLSVHYTKKPDVYSFGIICFQILTKRSKVYDSYESLYKRLTEKDERPEIPGDICPLVLSSLIRKCWQTNPLWRPTFREISAELRYFKGLLLLSEPLKGKEKQIREEALFRTDMIMSQGPFGVTFYTKPLDYQSQGTAVRAIRVFTRPHKVKPYESRAVRGSQVIGFRVQYDLNGRTIEALHGSDKHDPPAEIPEWIHFNYPSEYLIKVSGWTTLMPNAYHKDYPGPFVTSLTFTTNRATYGPYGTRDADSEEFSTTSGGVVGFFGWSKTLLHSIGVHMAPDQSGATSD